MPIVITGCGFEARDYYLKKAAAFVREQLLDSSDRLLVGGIVFAGSGSLKDQLLKEELLHYRLREAVLGVVDIQHKGVVGFNEAIDKSREILKKARFSLEETKLSKFFDAITKETGLAVYGVEQTLRAVELGVINTLFVWKCLETKKFIVSDGYSTRILYGTTTEEALEKISKFKYPSTWKIEEEIPLLEEIKKMDTKSMEIVMIDGVSEAGTRFCKGFGGLTGLMHYAIDLAEGSDVDEDPVLEE